MIDLRFRTFLLSNNKNTLKKMSKVKEHVFHGNKILEYPNGTFTATKFPSDNPDNDIISKDCKSLPEAKAFIRGEQHPREPKFTRLTSLHEKDLYAVENLVDRTGKKAFCVLTEYGIFIVYEVQWKAFVEANNDFNSKSAAAYKAFEDLAKWSQYSKKQIK